MLLLRLLLGHVIKSCQLKATIFSLLKEQTLFFVPNDL